MSAARTLRLRVREYLFAPQDPTTLALARVVVFALLFWKGLSRAWQLVPLYPDWFLLRGAAGAIDYVGSAPLDGITAALLIAAALGLLGVATRWMAATCFVAMYLLSAIDGGNFDSDGVLISFLLVLVAARSDDVLALGRPLSGPASWEYRWPLRVLQLTFALVYFEAGVEKLRSSGLAWVGPDTLAGWHVFHAVRDGHYFTYGDLLFADPTLATAAAGSALLLELAFWIVVFYAPARRLLVPATWLMHVGIGLTLNIWFTSYLFLLPLFFDLSRPLSAIALGRRGPGTATAPAPAPRYRPTAALPRPDSFPFAVSDGDTNPREG